MKTIKVKPDQTVYDIALEQYGTCEAVAEILRNNPELKNAPGVVGFYFGADGQLLVREADEEEDAPSGLPADEDLYLDLALQPDQDIRIDDESDHILHSVLRHLENPITTFDL